MNHRRGLAFLAPALVACGLLACVRPTPISEVRQRSQELEGHRVTVEGQVDERVELPLLRDRYYRIDDGTGHLWIQTSQSTPAEGQRVRVTGTLSPGIKAPGLEAGLVVQEAERTVSGAG
jgi:hypothetical protein